MRKNIDQHILEGLAELHPDDWRLVRAFVQGSDAVKRSHIESRVEAGKKTRRKS